LVLSAGANAFELAIALKSCDAEILRKSGAEMQETPILVGMEHTSDAVCSLECADKVESWFEQLLEVPRLRLVEAGAMSGTGESPTNNHFANAPNTLLMVSEASLAEFGRQCGLAVPANRFRANLEVSLSSPFIENSWQVGQQLAIGSLRLEAAGRCVRCQAVDIDPEDSKSMGPSLLSALATTQGGSGKGPTFGVLLRLLSCYSHHEHLATLNVGMWMSVHDHVA